MSTDKKEKKKSKFAIDRENAWLRIDKEEKREIDEYARGYIDFLSRSKTERLFHDFSIEAAEKAGFVSLEKKISLHPGDKVYFSQAGRTVLFMTVGRKPLSEGMNLVGGHIDSPRLDTKPNPLYEESEMAFFDTHYYGGIKKYQWVTIPLAIHGFVVKQDGTKVKFSIGENPEDPVFTITDLLPHLGKDQSLKTMAEGISGEGLNLLIASIPVNDDDVKLKVKEAVLVHLHDKYNITEEDFNSADIEIVPAGPARDLGFDRSMILGYGHDDRVCSFAAIDALINLNEVPEYSAGVLLCDKEEIGSYGATGMESFFFENVIAEIFSKLEPDFSVLSLKRAMKNSKMISADVNSLHDPNFPEVSSPNNNMPVLNGGTIIQKYTGARGKSGASEASPEFVAEIRDIFNKAKVIWQTGELGKVDMGGGGTIAYYMARYGMDVIDCGPGILSMHSPFEVCSKLDAYMTRKAYSVFLKYKRR